MKKIKLLLTALVLILIMPLCMGCENEITGTAGSGGNPVFANGKYKLSVRNDSTQSGNFCIYQIFPEQERPNNIYSLVWFSKTVHPNQRVLFEWNTNFSFVWLETGKLKLGVTVANAPASQIKDADPSDPNNNIIVLSKKNDVFLFSNAGEMG